jgi:hypothetical protein
MRGLPFIISVVGGLGVTACSPLKPVHDKAYFLAHPDERSAAIADCRADPGEIEKPPNCINASSAAADVESDRFWAIKKPKSRVAHPGSL